MMMLSQQNSPWIPWKGTASPETIKIVATTAHKQILQEDLGLPEHKQKCKEVTASCNFEATYDKHLWDAILLG